MNVGPLPFTPEDIIDASKVADRCGVALDTVLDQWMLDPTFPVPLVSLTIGPIWYAPEIEQWCSRRAWRERRRRLALRLAPVFTAGAVVVAWLVACID